MSFHLKLSLDLEELMIDPKLMDIMMEMVTSTLNTMDPGKYSPKRKLLHSLPHRTHFTLTSSHSMPSLDQEELTIDPKLTVTMTVMVTSTLKTMDHGKHLLKRKLLHLPPHKIHFILTSSHSMLSPDQEELMIDPKLTDIMTEMVMLTLKTMDPGKLLPKRKLLHLPPHRTHFTQTNFHSMPCPDQEEHMIDPKLMDIMMEMVT